MTDSSLHSRKDGRSDSWTESRTYIRTAGKKIAEHSDHNTDRIAINRTESRIAA